MKIWRGHGSEHSSNLILIGTFKNAATAERVKEQFDRLSAVAGDLPERDWDDPAPRFAKETRDLLSDMRLWEMSRTDLDVFAFDHSVELNGERMAVKTEELDIQGFLKVLVGAGARVEIYSAHDWNDDGTPRVSEQAPSPSEPAETTTDADANSTSEHGPNGPAEPES